MYSHQIIILRNVGFRLDNAKTNKQKLAKMNIF